MNKRLNKMQLDLSETNTILDTSKNNLKIDGNEAKSKTMLIN